MSLTTRHLNTSPNGVFIEFISHSLEYMCLIKASYMFILLSQHDVIDVMDQCDVLWASQTTKIFSDCIITEDDTVNIRRANKYCQFYVIANNFFSLMGIEKTHSANQ